jgi:diaminohydroxyphosphoribosylaminopyrimidine deaminase/5-amino-6-(5-phosphoribosylamino)uracil reductase
VIKSIEHWMDRALDLALLGLGRTGTNPIVGAVLVRDDVVIGEGHHEALGGPHAEIIAIQQAGEAARGSSLFVTLEPCAHFGRTGPCVDAIIEAGIKEVFVAAHDPNPIASGGADRLESAGIQVYVGALRERALWENRAWRHWVENLESRGVDRWTHRSRRWQFTVDFLHRVSPRRARDPRRFACDHHRNRNSLT